MIISGIYIFQLKHQLVTMNSSLHRPLRPGQVQGLTSTGSLLKICDGRRTLSTSYTATRTVAYTVLPIFAFDHADLTRMVPMSSVRLSVYRDPAKVATGLLEFGPNDPFRRISKQHVDG